MFLGEHRFEVVWIYVSMVPIPLFWVDVPMASEGIGLCSEVSRVEADGEVELGEVLRPTGLSPCTYLGHVTRPAEGENWPSMMGQQRGGPEQIVTVYHRWAQLGLFTM